MHKIAIVVDSSVGFTLEEQSQLDGVFVTPLSIIYNNKEYVDQHELSVEDVQEILSRNELIKTSQPSVGAALEQFEKIQAEGYTDIIVLSLSSALSGTFNSFSTAAKSLAKNNVHIIDTMTIAGVVQGGIKVVQRLDAQGYSVNEILKELTTFYEHTESYVIPENLDQLKASGRISPAAATLASLLKMKVLLKLANHGTTIEKLTTARTETKLLNAMYDDINKSPFNPKNDKFHILYSLNKDKANQIKNDLINQYGDIEVEIGFLPAALSGHAGNGTVVVQWFRNDKTFK